MSYFEFVFRPMMLNVAISIVMFFICDIIDAIKDGAINKWYCSKFRLVVLFGGLLFTCLLYSLSYAVGLIVL